MKKFIIIYSKDARNDLKTIKRYIKYNLQEPDIADKLIVKIKEKIKKILDNPQMFSIIDEEFIKKLEIRKFMVDNYIVFYRIKGNSIEIVRIMYERRNWIALL